MRDMSSMPMRERQENLEVHKDRWMTVIYNNDFTPIDVVVTAVMLATDCSQEEAAMETWEAQYYGKAPIHFATESECARVAIVMHSVGVESVVKKEWED